MALLENAPVRYSFLAGYPPVSLVMPAEVLRSGILPQRVQRCRPPEFMTMSWSRLILKADICSDDAEWHSIWTTVHAVRKACGCITVRDRPRQTSDDMSCAARSRAWLPHDHSTHKGQPGVPDLRTDRTARSDTASAREFPSAAAHRTPRHSREPFAIVRRSRCRAPIAWRSRAHPQP